MAKFKEKYFTATKGLVNVVQGFLYTKLLDYGENLQQLAKAGLRDYDLWQGHLSNFALGAMVGTPVSYFMSGVEEISPRNQIFVLLTMGAGLAFCGEVIIPVAERIFSQPGADYIYHFDGLDVLFYTFGPLVPHFVNQALNSDLVSNIFGNHSD